MDDTKSYIKIDEQGVKRVAGTSISLDSVVIGFQQGQSPEEIQRNCPALNLEQVYGAIAYYLGHRQEVEEYLREQRAIWDKTRVQSERNPSAAIERLRMSRLGTAGQVR